MKEMSLVEHLEELRTTVIRVAVIVIVAFVLAYGLGEYISEILLTPLRAGLGSQSGGQIVYLGFWIRLFLSFSWPFGALFCFPRHCGSMNYGASLNLVSMITKPKWFDHLS